MLTAMAIFVIMISFLGQLISNTTTATNVSKGKLNADDQARFALDRIGDDLQKLSKRTDLDYKITKNPGTNDEFYFYSEVPGLGANSTGDVMQQSGMSLIGYRINSDYKLERYSEAIPWDKLSFLSYGADQNVLPATTILQKLAALDANKYHVLCDGIFRLEIQFLLRDGTYSYSTHLENGSNLLNVGADDVNSRRDPAGTGAPNICIGKDSASASIWRGLGWQDVSAVIVTLVVIDDSARKILPSGGVGNLVGKFDETNVASDLPMKKWQQTIDTGVPGVPKKAMSGLRVYQRAFYLSTL
jgi:hypothetical protein